MYSKIIWATDGSRGAEAALAEALKLSQVTGGSIVAVHCDQLMPGGPLGLHMPADREQRRLRIEQRVDELREQGVDIELIVRRSHDEAASLIAEIAADVDGDVIVCGSRGRGELPGLFLGRFGLQLMRVTRCPVLTVPERIPGREQWESTRAEVEA